MPASSKAWPWWRRVFTGLNIVALTLSLYLSWHYLAGGAVIGCGGGSPCEEVLTGRWSAIAGVLPVSGLAAGAYLAMLLAGFFIGPGTDAPVRQLAWSAILVLAGAAAGSAVWFTIVQKWIIGSFCPYCMATHIIGVSLAILVVWRTATQRGSGSGWPEPAASTLRKPDFAKAGPNQGVSDSSRRRFVGGRALAGLALACILAACQVGFAPPAVYRDGESKEALPILDPKASPLIGSAEAPNIVNLLFDYKCPHCQQLHWMLEEVIRQYEGNVAFALCPSPLNRQCNPYIPRDVDEFKDSCELARVGLAVWKADREAFHAFDRWMFSYESGDRWQPRPLDAAKAKAVELLGQEKFAVAQADPWIDEYLQICIRIYGATVTGGNNAVPKMVYGSRWVIPQPNNADDLVIILRDSLGIALPGETQNQNP